MKNTANHNLPSFDTCRDAFDSAPGVCNLFDDDLEVVTLPDAIPLRNSRKRGPAAALRPPPPSVRPVAGETVDLRSLMGRVASLEDGVDTFVFPPPVETVTTLLPTALTQPAPARLRYSARRASSFVLGALATVAAGLAMIHPIASFRSSGTSAVTAPNPVQVQQAATTAEPGSKGPMPSPVEAAAAQTADKPASTPANRTAVREATPASPESRPAAQPLPPKREAATSIPTAESLPAPMPPAAPTPALPSFDARAALAGMQAAIGAASGCRSEEDPSAVVRVSVTFASSGSVTIAQVDGAPYAGTKTGSCVAKVFRSLRVDPFEGQPVTVHKSFLIR